MRTFVLCLILTNLGFWAWSSWIVPPTNLGGRYDGPGVTLYREINPSSRRASAAIDANAGRDLGFDWNAVIRDPQLAVELPPRDRCIAIGPFTDEDNIDAAMTTLAAAGFDPEATLGEAEIWAGYWVFVGAIPGMDIASAMLAEVAAAGIEDAYIIPESDSGILISLGVFSEASRVASQVARVNRLGFEATVADDTRTAEATWIELRVSEDEVERFASLRHPGRPEFVEQRACADAVE